MLGISEISKVSFIHCVGLELSSEKVWNEEFGAPKPRQPHINIIFGIGGNFLSSEIFFFYVVICPCFRPS